MEQPAALGEEEWAGRNLRGDEVEVDGHGAGALAEQGDLAGVTAQGCYVVPAGSSEWLH